MNAKVTKRFIINMAILTFVMFTVWALVRSFMNRPPGDYETEVCDMRLKDKKYEEAIEAANTALQKTQQSVSEEEKIGLKKRATFTALLLCVVFSYIYVKQVFN